MAKQAQKIYPGHKAFYSNKGNFKWHKNHKRPFLNLCTTQPDGERAYLDMWLNRYNDELSVKVKNGMVVIKFPVKTNQPIFTAKLEDTE
jgi:hypothetical protein